MKTALLILYLVGVVIGMIAGIRYYRDQTMMTLEDLLLFILIIASSFVGIAFLLLWHLCEIIANKFGNPVIWRRNK